MKDQVTSIEQSKRLRELGVPAEKASTLWYRHKISKDTWTEWDAVWTEWELVCGRQAISASVSSDVVPAFTVGDLMEMMPAYIPNGSLFISHLATPRCKGGWQVFYKKVDSPKGVIKECYNIRLVDACCDMVEWLSRNRYI